MHSTRLEIMKLIHQSPTPKATQVKDKVSQYYGELTFGVSELEKKVPTPVLDAYKAADQRYS